MFPYNSIKGNGILRFKDLSKFLLVSELINGGGAFTLPPGEIL